MAKLKRSINWVTFALYGLGNILGAGIYVLIGEVAGVAGNGLIWSFLVAGIVASFTAITYGALVTRYPVSAGEAIYVMKAFKSRRMSTLIGLALAFSGVVSSSALLRGFNRYFQELLKYVGVDPVASYLVIVVVLFLLGFVAIKGIKGSALLAVIFTAAEVGGLLLIIWVAANNGNIGEALSQSATGLSSIEPLSIMLGAFLAFYAFIGFEDMVNIAEEVKEPKKSIKKGMIFALLASFALYFAVVIASLSVLSSKELAASNAPLAAVFSAATGSAFPIITIIGLFAVTNGVMAQILMSSRILFGLSREGWLPKSLSNISGKNRTPTVATYISLLVIGAGALALPLGTLAQITSLVILIIFSVVQLAAIRLGKKTKLDLHPIIPVLGLITNFGVISIQVLKWLNVV